MVELVVGAVVVALGINMLATLLVEESRATALVVGAIAVLLPMAYFAGRTLELARRTRTFDGFFIFDEEKHEIVEIPHYHFGMHLSRYLSALAAENEAFRKFWDERPLEDGLYLDQPSSARAKEFIRQAVEYYILKSLSVHLSGHFENRFDEDEFDRLARRDMPDVLLDNRFLKLFSEPLEERAAFSAETSSGEGRIIAASGASGEIFEEFELVLPKKSRVTRESPTTIAITTPRLVLRISTSDEFFGSLVDVEFYRWYLKLDWSFERFADVRATVSVDARLRWRSLLLARWSQYGWVDSLFDRLDHDFGQATFLDDIGWATARTVLRGRQ